jgi:hypothetical protein
MANERHQDKSAAKPRKPADGLLHQPRQPPQVRSPLFNDGLELERDSHC